MIPGYTLADVPVILGSIDPCLACTDRVQVVDVRRGVVRYFTLVELAKNPSVFR